MSQTSQYNDRLFNQGGLRASYHLARYHWLKRKLSERSSQVSRLIEIGCLDAKTLEFLPGTPEHFLGIDANWEGGLDEGIARYGDRSYVELLEETDPNVLTQFSDNHFDTAISLETLEHLPQDVLEAYVKELARVTDGYFYVTVPNEMGPVFAAKYLLKKIAYGSTENYTFGEFLSAATFRPDKVARDEHKGFDWRALVKLLAQQFEIVEIGGVPSIGLPPMLSLTVGIVARSKSF